MSLFDRPTAESGHINVIAEITAAEGYADDLRTLLTAMVEPSRQEYGCRGYHLLESTTVPGCFYTFEEWTSEDALYVHLGAAQAKLDEARAMLAHEPKLTVLAHLV